MQNWRLVYVYMYECMNTYGISVTGFDVVLKCHVNSDARDRLEQTEHPY